MKAVKMGCAAMTIALAACSGQNKGLENGLLEQLPVVAHSVKVDGHDFTVCELSLFNGDTFDLPLSFWVEDFQPVKLDGKDDALVGQGAVYPSDHYIVVGKANDLPCKLFRRDGSYVGNLGNIGQGPGEYMNVYDVQIDEAAGAIYMLPWNAKSIYVYNLEGKYIKDIPLTQKYQKMVVPKGKFMVDAAKNRVTVMLLPFDYLPVVAWVQDLEGNFLHEVPMNHLKVTPDFSNEVVSVKSSPGVLDAYILTFWELRPDTLYHVNLEDAKLLPRFTLDFGGRKMCIHDYFEFPKHFVGSLASPVQLTENTYTSKDDGLYMVDKETGKGTFFRVGNDFLDGAEIEYMPWSCNNGYYTLNIEPAVLMERLEKGLKGDLKLDENRRKEMENWLSEINEDDNNYIFIGKLRTDFSSVAGK